jgi:DNA-nicking Smr family endonuclease
MAKTAGSRAAASHDRTVWAEAMREVTPLRGRRAPILPELQAEPGPSAENLPTAPADTRPFDSFAGIDRANAERLKRGLHPIEARLDLHGRTQAEAHRELADFVCSCHEAGRRCVLVITGRGLGPDGPGILKSAVPRWLEEAGLRRRILAVAAAQPRHGGGGALYLLLRRQR